MKKKTKNKLIVGGLGLILVIGLGLVIYFGVLNAILTNDTQYGVFRQQAGDLTCSDGTYLAGGTMNLDRAVDLMREGKCEEGYNYFSNQLDSKGIQYNDGTMWHTDCRNKVFAFRDILSNYYCSGYTYDDKVQLNETEKEEIIQDIEEQIEEEIIEQNKVYYRFLDNECNEVLILDVEKTSNDYSTLSECESKIETKTPINEEPIEEQKQINESLIIGISIAIIIIFLVILFLVLNKSKRRK